MDLKRGRRMPLLGPGPGPGYGSGYGYGYRYGYWNGYREPQPLVINVLAPPCNCRACRKRRRKKKKTRVKTTKKTQQHSEHGYYQGMSNYGYHGGAGVGAGAGASLPRKRTSYGHQEVCTRNAAAPGNNNAMAVTTQFSPKC
ncbi:unnamed protein product [Urochloa humidicola]